MRGGSPRATTVDSRPCRAGPPSRTRRPGKSAATCAARVGLGRPERFALGAAIGTPAASMRARATGWSGTRTATVGRPAVTTSGTLLRFARTIVSGPGQKRAASARASGGISGTSLPDHRQAGDVDDERVVVGPSLRLEDPPHRLRVEGVGPEAVDRLRREGDRLAPLQGGGGTTKGGGRRGRSTVGAEFMRVRAECRSAAGERRHGRRRGDEETR